MFSELYATPTRPANFARFVFLDPRAETFYTDWDRAARDTAEILRAPRAATRMTMTSQPGRRAHPQLQPPRHRRRPWPHALHLRRRTRHPLRGHAEPAGKLGGHDRPRPINAEGRPALSPSGPCCELLDVFVKCWRRVDADRPARRRRAMGGSAAWVSPVAIITASLVLGFLSLLLPSAPTYDPIAWLIWGREIAHLDLSTVHGPSWKPLPVIVTTLTAPLGEASIYMWVAVARAGAIAAILLSGVLAARLANRTAGVLAAVALAAMPWWLRNGAMGNSEGIMVALVLGTALCHLQGRKGWAFTLAIGAGLLRPEAWPFLGLYALLLLWEDRTRLKWIAGGLAVLPVLWFAPEYWGSGNALRASERARDPRRTVPPSPTTRRSRSSRARSNWRPSLRRSSRSWRSRWPAWSSRARRGRRRPAPERRSAIAVLVLGTIAVAWIGLVAVMTARGFSGNPRYLMVPAALLIVLGAVGAGGRSAPSCRGWRRRWRSSCSRRCSSHRTSGRSGRRCVRSSTRPTYTTTSGG